MSLADVPRVSAHEVLAGAVFRVNKGIECSRCSKYNDLEEAPDAAMLSGDIAVLPVRLMEKGLLNKPYCAGLPEINAAEEVYYAVQDRDRVESLL